MHEVISANSATRFGERPSVLIFWHIPKCAGTSVLKILEDHFGEAFYTARTIDAWKALDAKVGGTQHSAMAIGGHGTWGIHEVLSGRRDVFYMTMLRHPVTRVLSHYRHMRQSYMKPCSLREYVAKSQPNTMVRFLGNGSLSIARERLCSELYFFGIVERFDESISVLGKRLGCELEKSVVMNRSRWGEASVDQDMFASVAERNAQDMELYEWAVVEFERRLREIGDVRSGRSFAPADGRFAETTPHYIEYSDDIIDLLQEGDYETAVRKIEALPYAAERLAICIHLGKHYEELRNKEKAEYWKRRAVERNSAMVFQLASFYARNYSTYKAVRVIQDVLEEFEGIESRLPDSALNRFRQEALSDITRYQEVSYWRFVKGRVRRIIRRFKWSERLLEALKALKSAVRCPQSCEFADCHCWP
jgi:hypothetical protein